MVLLVAVLVLALIITIFALKNSQMISLDLFFVKIDISLALLIFACVLLGMLIMFIISLFKDYKKAKEIKEIKKDRDLYKGQMEKLRADFAVSESNLRQAKRDNNPKITMDDTTREIYDQAINGQGSNKRND